MTSIETTTTNCSVEINVGKKNSVVSRTHRLFLCFAIHHANANSSRECHANSRITNRFTRTCASQVASREIICRHTRKRKKKRMIESLKRPNVWAPMIWFRFCSPLLVRDICTNLYTLSEYVIYCSLVRVLSLPSVDQIQYQPSILGPSIFQNECSSTGKGRALMIDSHSN